MKYNRKLIYSILLALFLCAIILFLALSLNARKNGLQIVFLNVGQGDAILISQGSTQTLIDGGKDGKLILEKLARYVPFWDRTIENVILTHPDQDHLGGLIEVAKTYQIKTVLETADRNDSQADKYWEQLISEKNIEKIDAKKGVTLKFPQGGEMKVLYPIESINDQSKEDTNSTSVITKLEYGSNKFLFTGDFPTAVDKTLFESGQNLAADVLKISHHGSKYATSEEFLEKTNPKVAIISVGKNNSYGHPSVEVLQRLRTHGIEILRTDEMGDIVYECENEKTVCSLSR